MIVKISENLSSFDHKKISQVTGSSKHIRWQRIVKSYWIYGKSY